MSIVALICPRHGFVSGSHCPQCEKDRPKSTVYVNDYAWVREGEYEHIDDKHPDMRFESKEQLMKACEERGLLAKPFMKPKSQGKGWEHSKGYRR